MKRIAIGLSIVAVTGGALVFFVRPVAGADVITDQQIQAIRTNCTEMQGTLNRLQQSDVLARINRGSLYRTMSDKLMVPLNQRAASNQLDGSKLVAITAEFNTMYRQFYEDYQLYDNALAATIRIDCVKQPTQFYDALANTRTKRAALAKVDQALVKLLGDYKKEFTIFRAKVSKEMDSNE